MQFSTSTLFAAAAATLFSTATAQGIFAIQGNTTQSDTTSVYLEVLNGLVTDPPVCSGTNVFADGSPIAGSVPCASAGYSLSFTWTGNDAEGIQATYATPSSSPFTYNVPNLNCTDNTCQWGFQDIFNDKLEALHFVSNHD